MIKIEKEEDFPECFQCGDVRSQVFYQMSLEDAVEYCEDNNLSQEWIDWVVAKKTNWENYKKGLENKND